VKPLSAPWKPAGEVFASLAPPESGKTFRTTTDGIAGDGNGIAPVSSKDVFNFGRHRWLALVVRDAKLPGAAHRVAVLLWQLQRAERGCAWPSLTYIAAQLNMHKATVVRSLQALYRRGWITKRRRGGRHRSNEYTITFGSMDDGRRTTTKRSHPRNERVAARHPNNRKDKCRRIGVLLPRKR
jgi:hypothetical protein